MGPVQGQKGTHLWWMIIEPENKTYKRRNSTVGRIFIKMCPELTNCKATQSPPAWAV